MRTIEEICNAVRAKEEGAIKELIAAIKKIGINNLSVKDTLIIRSICFDYENIYPEETKEICELFLKACLLMD